jgi:glycosyltransferase involved in cell wall biosynthesis
MPVVTTRVSGIPSLITHEVNGLLIDEATADGVAGAVERVITDAPLRRRLIANGYETARARTLEAQAAKMMAVVAQELRVPLRRPADARDNGTVRLQADHP